MAAAAASASSLTTTHMCRTVKAAALALASAKVFEVSETKKVLLIKTAEGNIHATSSTCPHYGLPLGKATVAGNCISCPFHGAKFDVRTGDIEDGPSFDKIATYPATVGSDGYVYVEFPDGDKSAEKIMPDYCSTSGSSEKRHFVIVGAGTASHAAVEELRTSGFTGKITVISRDEPGQLHHFDRTALSKFLNVGAEKLPLRSDEWWSDRDVKLMLGRTVTAIDAATKIVTTDDGSCVAYDACLCATSGPARSFRKDRAEGFAIEGADLGNIFVCRDPSDSAAIHSAVKGRPGARVVVVGSSFIGMEVAGFLAKHHKLSNASERTVESITVVGMETEPFERVLGTEMGAAMRKLHERHGVAFAMSDTVAAFHPTASCSTTVGSVSLKSGATLQADICVIGAGMIPAVDYLRDTAGVTLAPRGAGVVVDATLQAAPGLFACGDIARFPYAQATSSGESFVRIEHWNVAIAHGRVAARNMLSGAGMTAFDVVPFFWSSQLGHNIRYAGHAESCDEVVLQGNFATPQVTAFYCKDGKVAAVATLQDDPQAVAARDLMQMGKMPTAEAIKAETKFDLHAELQKVSTSEECLVACRRPLVPLSPRV